jgi:uncharacterized DUF497 family protein
MTSVEVSEFVWSQDRIEHVGRHSIEPDEFEQVCFGNALVLRAKSEGKNPVYYVLGETAAGRHLFCVVIRFPDGKGYPVTAREMTPSEKERYSRWKT